MNTKKILVVDDDPDILLSSTIVLEHNGYEVFQAKSVKQGLKRIKEAPPDLIILDVMLETMCDGFDLARELKSNEKFKHIPILLVTAIKEKTGFDMEKNVCVNAWVPVDDYLEKPLDPAVLITRIKRLLAAKKNTGGTS